jgi:hypothetical protein
MEGIHAEFLICSQLDANRFFSTVKNYIDQAYFRKGELGENIFQRFSPGLMSFQNGV